MVPWQHVFRRASWSDRWSDEETGDQVFNSTSNLLASFYSCLRSEGWSVDARSTVAQRGRERNKEGAGEIPTHLPRCQLYLAVTLENSQMLDCPSSLFHQVAPSRSRPWRWTAHLLFADRLGFMDPDTQREIQADRSSEEYLREDEQRADRNNNSNYEDGAGNKNTVWREPDCTTELFKLTL